MISFFQSSILDLSIHRVGNKLQDEGYVLSGSPIELKPEMSPLLLSYFLSPFEKVNEVFEFYHPSGDTRLNYVFDTVKKCIEAPEYFHEFSEILAKHLFEISNHPKIKSGEFYLVYFEGVQFRGDILDAVGIFKSENKETFFTVHPNMEGFNLSFEQEGISLSNMDKGCLILNDPAGLKVLTVDKNRKESSYWVDEFLQLKAVNDDYQKTSCVLSLAKEFITSTLDEEFEISATDKADLLNKSIQYFKENESFDIDEFSAEVFQNQEATTKFKKYRSIYDEEFDTQTPDSFGISDTAVKKKASQFKAILKLDKNFHIYVHGNKELIERGFDEDRSMNYYKVYFRDEA